MPITHLTSDADVEALLGASEALLFKHSPT